MNSDKTNTELENQCEISSDFWKRTLTLATHATLCALKLAVLSALLVSASRPARAQTESVLYTFTGTPDGEFPFAGLIRDTKGNLYGTTTAGGAFGNGTVFEVTPQGKETILSSFNHYGSDFGEAPYGGLVRDSAGNLYGTTNYGGASLAYGAVFKVTPTGAETVLYSFTGSGKLGGSPWAGLVRDAKGNLYGTNSSIQSNGPGSVFELTAAGVAKTLHAFSGLVPDGETPIGGLLRDSAGNLYGTTRFGGGGFSYGTVFKVTPAGKETILHSFTGPPDGERPFAGLVRDTKGNLYGTTGTGGYTGSGCGATGCGVVFKVTPAGVETVLYSFTGAPDGSQPWGNLTQGNLYGTTLGGGVSGCGVGIGCGTVFKVTPAGNETVLYTFSGGTDGANPYAGLVRDSAGILYGTTFYGGNFTPNTICESFGCGVVFKVGP